MKGILFEDEYEFATIGETERLIAESIKRIVMTNPGERVNNLDFGFGIKNYLFQGMDTIQLEFKKNLTSQIEANEPRVLVKEILFNKISEHSIKIRFIYVIRESYLNEQFLDLEVGV